jgi:hypothetical protein
MERFRVLYAPEGADGGGTPAATSTPAPAVEDSYGDQFGVEETVDSNMFDPDKLEKTEPMDFDEPQTIPETTEETPTEEQPQQQEQKPPVDASEVERIKQEYEQYRQTEQERFKQFYQQMQEQAKAVHEPVAKVEEMFNNPEFIQAIESAEDGKDVAKIIMTETIKMTQNLLKTQLAPVFNVVQQYQQEQVQTKVNNVINEFKGKYGAEAEKALTPNTPENKAILNELQQNPNLSLEKAFLLIRPNFVKQQVSQEVKKEIAAKQAMALPPSTGRSTPAATKKVDTIEDALNMALRSVKSKNN